MYDGAKSLLNAPHFSELLKVRVSRWSDITHSQLMRIVLLQLILMLGNFLNATGHKGGAFGFKLTSINKLVDTKSSASSDRTLLHFLAKTVTRSIPETESFLEELSAPADAHKGTLILSRRPFSV